MYKCDRFVKRKRASETERYSWREGERERERERERVRRERERGELEGREKDSEGHRMRLPTVIYPYRLYHNLIKSIVIGKLFITRYYMYTDTLLVYMLLCSYISPMCYHMHVPHIDL